MRLDEKIQSTVPLELEGVEEAPGVKEGGVLEHVTRELHDRGAADRHSRPDRRGRVRPRDRRDDDALRASRAPAGVELLDDLEETVVATVTAPSEVVEEPEEVEEEAELVGEEGEAAEGEAPAEGAEAKPRGQAARLRRGRRAGLECARCGTSLLRLFGGRRRGAPVDYLVVGLGNPGSRYAGTRHNVGFEVAEPARASAGSCRRAQKPFGGLVSEGRAGAGGPRVAVLLPQTLHERVRARGRTGARQLPACRSTGCS